MKTRIESMQINKPQLFIEGIHLTEGDVDTHLGRAEPSLSTCGSFQQQGLEVKQHG